MDTDIERVEELKKYVREWKIRTGLDPDKQFWPSLRGDYGYNEPQNLNGELGVLAVLEALAQEGVPAWNGDGTGIVGQIITYQFNRYKKAQEELDGLLHMFDNAETYLNLIKDNKAMRELLKRTNDEIGHLGVDVIFSDNLWDDIKSFLEK